MTGPNAAPWQMTDAELAELHAACWPPDGTDGEPWPELAPDDLDDSEDSR